MCLGIATSRKRIRQCSAIQSPEIAVSLSAAACAVEPTLTASPASRSSFLCEMALPFRGRPRVCARTRRSAIGIWSRSAPALQGAAAPGAPRGAPCTAAAVPRVLGSSVRANGRICLVTSAVRPSAGGLGQAPASSRSRARLRRWAFDWGASLERAARLRAPSRSNAAICGNAASRSMRALRVEAASQFQRQIPV